MKPTLMPFSLLLSTTLLAQAPPALPVREVTVFKDGHAYVIREMALPAGSNGKVVLDELPVPVLGTFWPFAADGARLVAAKAGRERVVKDLPAVSMVQLARANAGKNVVVVMDDKERIEGKLLAVPERAPPKAPPEASPPAPVVYTAPEPPLLLVQTASGTRALSMARVRDLEVQGELAATVREEIEAERLTLTVDGGGPAAKVGVMYVQKGLRWIPSYRLDIDGAGKVAVQLEATLVNDLVDLDHATVNVVIGVPQFAFAGLVDPISLQQEIAQVSAFARGARFDNNLLSNSIMTQGVGYEPSPPNGTAPPAAGGDANEDLFVFRLRDVTLAKGERLVVPLAACDLTYTDAYTLDVPFTPPLDLRQHQNGEQVMDLMRKLAAPKVKHVLRLKNTGTTPLTTAPALVLAKGRVLAQGHMTYTPIGGQTDLEINVAIDVCVKSSEQETGRQNAALRIGSDHYSRIDLAGAIELHNLKSEAVTVEVSRRVLGLLDDVGQNGTKAQLDAVQVWADESAGRWWSWWSWPHWWFRQNGFGELRWTVELQPGAATKLEAKWHYFWQ